MLFVILVHYKYIFLILSYLTHPIRYNSSPLYHSIDILLSVCYELHTYICWVPLIIPLWVWGCVLPCQFLFFSTGNGRQSNIELDVPRGQGRSAPVETGGWAFVEVDVSMNTAVYIHTYSVHSLL